MDTKTYDNISTEPIIDTTTQPILRTNVILDDSDLSEKAKLQFSFHTEILRAFQMTSRIVLANDRLTPIGRHVFCTSVEENYRNCKAVLNYVASHLESQPTVQNMPPLFILCGPARTGTTLLYNLLACDPASRAPALLDMAHPIPPLARSDTLAQMQRQVMASTIKEKFKGLEPTDNEQERKASHPCYTYEEDVSILYQSGLLVPHLEPYNSTELANWFYDDTNKDFVYAYHRVFMQMLNSVDAPRSHWLLKTPYHIFNLDTLVRHYPSISLIMTHRRLDDVFPSSIRLGLAFARIYFDSNRNDTAIDRQTVIDRRLRATDVQINRIVKFRRAHPDVSAFDVLYDDLMTMPIDIVRRIYDHFGLAWSVEFEQAMLTWLRENPQGKQGRNTYTLDEFGLKRDKIEQQYDDYIRMFLKKPESLKEGDDPMKHVNTD